MTCYTILSCSNAVSTMPTVGYYADCAIRVALIKEKNKSCIFLALRLRIGSFSPKNTPGEV